MSAPDPHVALNWLFFDLNSYFASVEQQMNPALRGKPIAVVPVMSDSTCAIAASQQAKKFGVKTGTNIGEARRMCPGLILVEADHSHYVKFHERIKIEVERHYPVEKVCSIDEMALKLDGPRSHEPVALDLARRIKAGLRENVGECITCSIGLAPNKFLAKMASDLQKPDGLTILRPSDMPGKIAHWSLTDIYGIGRRMEPRLQAVGIRTVEELWAATPDVLRQVWGGVGGTRFWQELHGADLGDMPTQHRSIGHSHVLAPEFRKPPEAAVVARRLLFKAASRLRRTGYRASAVSLSVRTEDKKRGEAFHSLARPVADTFSFLEVLNLLWPEAMSQVRWARVKKIGVTLHGLWSNEEPEQLELFNNLDGRPGDQERRERLSRIMDDLNQTYGRDSLALGFVPNQVRTFSGTKIAFTRIPDLEEFQE